MRLGCFTLLFGAFAASSAFAQNAESLTANHTKERIVTVDGASGEIGLFIANGDGQNARPLLPTPAHDYDPSLSTDGKWVVFTSERDGFARVYRVHPDGTNIERLTDGTRFDDQGALSPDGRTLAFVSTRGDGDTANVWLLNLTTGAYRDLTQSRSGNFRPSWSPDGQWIAFSSDRDTPHKRNPGGWELEPFLAIYIVHPDGSGLHRLTPTDAYAGGPKWSLDGTHIVYSAAKDGFYPSQPMQIESVDIETGAKTELTSTPDLEKLSPQFVGSTEVVYASSASNRIFALTSTAGRQGPPDEINNPSWSQDGKIVVYDKFLPSPDAEPGELRPYADAHTKMHLFDNGMQMAGAYTKDGRQVAITRKEGQRNTISVMNSDGTHRRTLFALPDRQTRIDAMSWSPDGKLVAFEIGNLATRNPVTAAQLALIHADGSGLRMLTNDNNSNAYPSFSPDGKRIVFRVLGAEQGLRIISLADGKAATLTSDWDDFPSWSPRGDLVLFSSFRTGDYEIYTIRPDGTRLHQLTSDHGNDAHPIWSPDGKLILFSSSRAGYRDEAMHPSGPQGYGKLFLMRADGTGLTLFRDHRGEDAATAWLPPN